MDAYAIRTDEGKDLDARFEIDRSEIILYSRGGSKGKNETNPDYAKTLRLLLRRLSDNSMTIRGAWVDSSRVQGLPLSERVILSEDDLGTPPEELFTRMATRMQKVGRAKDAAGHGNATKRIRLRLQEDVPAARIAHVLGAIASSVDVRSQQRLPAEGLNKVTPEHIWNAIQLLLRGHTDHAFGESTDFDLVADDGNRLPPKAVFGIAATQALGFPVLPRHFSGGDGTPCFRVLRAAGYAIVPKAEVTDSNYPAQVPADEAWTEGKPKLVTHVRKERGPGLAKAKKAEFRRVYGKLFCERCRLDPVETYASEHGEACIEVHHHLTQIQDMAEGHVTRLGHLQCLCANCHRLVHRLLVLGEGQVE